LNWKFIKINWELIIPKMSSRAPIKNPLSDPNVMNKLLEIEEQVANNTHDLKSIQEIVGIYTVV
jgi:hypothetical protein